MLCRHALRPAIAPQRGLKNTVRSIFLWSHKCCELHCGSGGGGGEPESVTFSLQSSNFHVWLMVREAYERAGCTESAGGGGLAHQCCCWPGCLGSRWCGGCPRRSSAPLMPPPPSWPSSPWPVSSRRRCHSRSGRQSQSIWSCSCSCPPCHSQGPRRPPAPPCLQSQRTPA